MSAVSFYKYSGSGNDFILIDERVPRIPIWKPDLIQRLCHRQKGIGADGVILLLKSEKADVRMKIFNADGSQAEMCGNGLRCLAKLMFDLGFNRQKYVVETMDRDLTVEPIDEEIKASMGKPKDITWKIPLQIDETLYEAHFLDTGVPHVVIFMDEIDPFPVEKVGRGIRFHPHFSPKGTNANFVKILSKNSLAVRTYERGVEKETLACGTGVTASALGAAHLFGLSSPITVYPLSQEKIVVDFSFSPSREIESVFQIGPAEKHFSGVIWV